MSKAKGLLSLALGLGLLLGSVQLAGAQGVATNNTRAKVTRVTQFHNQTENGQKGMVIQMDLEIDGLAGQEVSVAAFFQWQNGNILTARQGKYRAANGQVTTQRTVIPNQNVQDYRSFELFIPYDELSLGVQGNYDFRFFADIAHRNGSGWTNLTTTPAYNFNLKQN